MVSLTLCRATSFLPDMVMSLRSLGSPGLYYVLTSRRKNPIPAPYPFSTTTPFICFSRLSLIRELLHSRVCPSSFPFRHISSSALAAPADNHTIVETESVSESLPHSYISESIDSVNTKSEGIKEVTENLKVNVRLVGNRKANSKERDTVLSRLHSLFAVPRKPRNKAGKKKEFNASVESTTVEFGCNGKSSERMNQLLHSSVSPSSFPSSQISSSALAAPADNHTIVEPESVSESLPHSYISESIDSVNTKSEGIKEVKENLKVNVRLVGNRKANSKESDTVLSRLYSLFAVPRKPRNKAGKKKEFNASVESTTVEFRCNGKSSERMNQLLHSRVSPSSFPSRQISSSALAAPADNHTIVEPESVSELLPHSYISENSDSVNTKSEGVKEVKENLKVNVRLVGNSKTNSKERETVLSRLHSLFAVPRKPRNKDRKKKEFNASVESTTMEFGWNGKSSEQRNEKQQENSISDETKEVKGNTMNTKELVKNHKSNPNSGHLETKGNGRDKTVVKKTSSLHSVFVKPPKLSQRNTISERKEFNNSVETKGNGTRDKTVVKKTSSLHSLFVKPPTLSQLNTISERKEFNNSVESIYVAEKVSAQKGLSPEMVLFAKHLNNEGYLSKANFLQEGQLDLDRLSSNYARDFLKFAAEKFGIDHQDIAIWLSGSDMKKVSLVGCPSVEKRTVFAAKSLRSFFSIDEDTVCGPCKLKSSCKFISQMVDKKEKLDLADALRVLTVYATNSGPQQLILSSEVEDSINKLLKEVVNLSK